MKTKAKTKTKTMNVDVILTFATINKHGDSQEWFNFDLPISADSPDAATLFDECLFDVVMQVCDECDHDPADLWKISTSSQWDVYEEITGNPPLPARGDPCVWAFGPAFMPYGDWTRELEERYGFGKNL